MKLRYKAAIVSVVLAAAIFSFPTWWGPWVVERVALSLLPSNGECKNNLDVKHIGLSSIEVSDIELAGLAMAPSCSNVVVRYSLLGLFKRHIDSVRICGVSFNPSWRVENVSMPSSIGGGGAAQASDDPLMGWSLGSLLVETMRVDLYSILPPEILPFITDSSISASLSATMGEKNGEATLSGDIFGGPISGKLNYARLPRGGGLMFSYLPPLSGTNSVTLGSFAVESDFSLSTTNGISALISGKLGFTGCDWRCGFSSYIGAPLSTLKVEVPGARFSDLEPLVATALDFAIIPDIVTDLHFGGDVSAKFDASFGEGREPRWSVAGAINEGFLSLNASGIPISLEGARSSVRIEGIADLWRLGSIPVSISKAKISSFELDRGRAFLRADDKSLMASEITIGFCGGSIRLYALYFNFTKLNTGFTVVLDSLDAGKLIQQLPHFEDATATGTLHGRLPLSITKEGEFRLRDGFIYSPPGETGNISIKNPDYIISALSSAGLPAPVCENFGKALQNLNYDILRFDLSQPRHANGRMQVRLKGESPSGKVSTPIDLNININGPIEELLNLAVKTAKIKGK